jgi:hypothetical protein
MGGNLGNLGAANPLKHARGLLMALTLGLMLACGTAYASESPSPTPVAMTKNAVNPTRSTLNADASPDVGDWIFDGSIAFLVIVMGAFISIGFWDSKEKSRE